MSKVLVVEDDPTILEGISKVLDQAGYEVATATNGQEGLVRLDGSPPDLILSDIMMPVMDGFEFYEALRSNPDLELVPFVFITARGRPEDIRRGMLLGVDDYLPKPFEPDDLLGAVDIRLRRSQGMREISRRELQTLKDRMLTMLGHELRTPLTFIKGYSEMAMMDEDNLDAESMMGFLSGINIGSRRLETLVNDMMRVLEIEGGQAIKAYESRRVRLEQLDELINETVEAYETPAAQADLALLADVQEDLPSIEADTVFLREALERLLDNAIKFSPPGGTVAVQTQCQDGVVLISVADEGRGIPIEEVPFIFDAFHQINRKQYEQQGVGLGLTIVRGLVELHGGHINVETEQGAGSIFVMVLPHLGR